VYRDGQELTALSEKGKYQTRETQTTGGKRYVIPAEEMLSTKKEEPN